MKQKRKFRISQNHPDESNPSIHNKKSNQIKDVNNSTVNNSDINNKRNIYDESLCKKLSKFDRELMVLQQSLPNQSTTQQEQDKKKSERKIFSEKNLDNFIVGNSNRPALCSILRSM